MALIRPRHLLFVLLAASAIHALFLDFGPKHPPPQFIPYPVPQRIPYPVRVPSPPIIRTIKVPVHIKVKEPYPVPYPVPVRHMVPYKVVEKQPVLIKVKEYLPPKHDYYPKPEPEPEPHYSKPYPDDHYSYGGHSQTSYPTPVVHHQYPNIHPHPEPISSSYSPPYSPAYSPAYPEPEPEPEHHGYHRRPTPYYDYTYANQLHRQSLAKHYKSEHYPMLKKGLYQSEHHHEHEHHHDSYPGGHYGDYDSSASNQQKRLEDKETEADASSQVAVSVDK